MVTTNPHGRRVDTEVDEAPRQFEPTYEIDGPYELPDRLWRGTKSFAGALILVTVLFLITRALLRWAGWM